MTPDEWRPLAEGELYKLQEKLIEAKYGAKAAGHANYGWVVEEEEKRVGVATKVYVEGGPMILYSEIVYPIMDALENVEWGQY